MEILNYVFTEGVTSLIPIYIIRHIIGDYVYVEETPGNLLRFSANRSLFYLSSKLDKHNSGWYFMNIVHNPFGHPDHNWIFLTSNTLQALSTTHPNINNLLITAKTLALLQGIT